MRTLMWQLIQPVRGRLLAAAVLGALATASAVALMAVSGWLIARAAQQPPILTLMVAVVAVRTFGLSRGLLRYLERLVSHDAALRVLAELRSRIVDRLAVVAPAGLPWWRRGDLQARVVQDVDDVQDLLLRAALPLFGAGVVGVATTVLLAAILPMAGVLLALALLLGTVLLPLWQARSAARLERADVQIRAHRTVVVNETFEQLTELTALGAVDEALAELAAAERVSTGLAGRRSRVAALAAGLGVAVVGLAAVAIGWFGSAAVDSGSLPAVLLAVLVLTPLALGESVSAVSAAVSVLPRSLAALRRVAAVLATPDPLPVQSGPLQALPAGGPVIRLTGVCARWPGAAADTISGIDLELHPGQRVVILGESGSGKSTLLAVLLGFLVPTAGTVTVQGVSSTELDRDDWRRLFAWTGDPAQVLAGSASDNLAFARPGSRQSEIDAALDRVGLGGLTGSGRPLGEHGTALSGGERQRLALARALLADRPVLLADEALAHLDPALADALAADLLDPAATGVHPADGRRVARCTVLVTHRPQDAAGADLVVRLQHGRQVAEEPAAGRPAART